MSAEKTMEEKRGRRRRRQVEEQALEDADDEQVEEAGDDDESRGLSERKGRATPGRRGQVEEEEEGNFITRPLYRIWNYFGDVRAELAKVAWPTRKETIELTRIVLVTTIISAIVLGAISLLFTELFRLGLDTPAILVIVIIGAVVVTVYYIRASNRRTTSF